MNIDPHAGLSSASSATSYVAVSATDETARELNKTYLKLIADSEQYPWLNHETRADGFNYPVDDLLAVTAIQSRSTAVIATLPMENPIAQKLAESIEKNAVTLQQLLNQTAGGALMFDFVLERMFNGLSSQPLEGINLENMFVLAMLDTLPHIGEGGLANLELVENITILLELLGSGSHNSSFFSPLAILSWANTAWSGLSAVVNAAPFGPDSLLHKAMTLINGGNPITATLPDNLQLQIMNYDNVTAGGWLNSSLDSFSPTVRTFILRDLMNKQTVTVAEMDTILSGTKAQIDQLLMQKTGQDALTFLSQGGKWRVQTLPSGQLPGGITQVIDYNPYITDTEASDLVTTFPGRDLTKEDLTEINNIGDQVKMIMQTLKYWLTTTRDERLSISRNMS